MLNIQKRVINNVLSNELRVYIFRNILCDSRMMDYFSMTLKEFYIFMEFMIFVNITTGKMVKGDKIEHFAGKSIFKVKDLEIEGMR